MSILSNQTKSFMTGPPLGFRSNNSDRAWAVILAGGDGLPQRALFPASGRGLRPRHFCRTAGSDFIINETRRMVSLAFAPENTMFTVAENHLSYCEEALEDVPHRNLIVEPQNDGTTFAILYSLLCLRQTNPNAAVAFFPANFIVPDARFFMKHVAAALDVVRRDPNLILLGIEPSSPDESREWIEPDLSSPLDENLKLWRARDFRERVSPVDARELMKRGGLWNSRVMVGTISTFLRKIRRATPDVYEKFITAESKIGTPGERLSMRRIYYGNYTDADFSRDVLAKSVEKLAVMAVGAAKVRAVGVKPQTVKRPASEKITAAAKRMAAPARRA